MTIYLNQRCLPAQKGLLLHIRTTSIMKKERLSLYVILLSGKQRDKGKSHASLEPLGCYSLLISHVGGQETSTQNPRVIERVFLALEQLVRESGAQVIFSFLLSVSGSDTGSNIQMQSIILCGWCHHHNFEYFNNRIVTARSFLTSSDLL